MRHLFKILYLGPKPVQFLRGQSLFSVANNDDDALPARAPRLLIDPSALNTGDF